jgi:putative ABC transport system permease protein
VQSEIRFAWRLWRRKPLVAAASVLTLALGTGANTALFRVVHAVMLKPLPYAQPGRLVQIWLAVRDPKAAKGISDPNKWMIGVDVVNRWRQLDTPFAEMGCYRGWQYTLTGDREPERVSAAVVSDGVFQTLGIAPALGRAFTPQEYTPGNAREAILGQRLWRRWFAGDPAALGRDITLDGYPYRIVGVMGGETRMEAAYAPEDPDLYTPFADLTAGGSRQDFGTAVGRLRPGVTLPAAQAQMEALSLATKHGRLKLGANLVPLGQEVASGLRPALLVLFAAAGCVLLIACANLANLMLAQAAGRQQELAVRAALGAGRARLVRQLLTECFLLAGAGAAAGLAVSWWVVRALVSLYPGKIPRFDAAYADPAAFGFAALLAVLTALAFGAVPAWRHSRPAIAGAIQTARRSSRLGAVLVAAQVAAALVLLIGAGLLLRSYALLRAIDPGFQRVNLLTAKIRLPEKLYKGPAQARFADELLERLRATAGVQAAGATNSMPLAMNFVMSGRFDLEDHRQAEGYLRTVTPGFLEAMGIRAAAGRLLDRRDDDGRAVVVNRSFALQYYGAESPVGKHILFEKAPAEIVGVVPDIRSERLQAGGDKEIYLPFAAHPSAFLDVAIRTAGDPAHAAQGVRAAVAAIDRNLPLGKMQTMEQILDGTVATPRFQMTLLGGFAAVAMLLAAVGIYGVVAYSVSRRTHEIGIRLAIGAGPADVLRLMLRGGLLPPLAGMLAGFPLAVAATRALESFLYGVKPLDAATYGTVAAMLLAVAAAAAWVPARRAMAVDPASALRE